MKSEAPQERIERLNPFFVLTFLALALQACDGSDRAPTGTAEENAAAGASATGLDSARESLVPDNNVGPDAEPVRADGSNVRFDPACILTEDSVAGIAMPDTLGDFVSAFPEGTVLSFYPNYMVDFGKLCLRSGGADAICADFESYGVEGYRPDIPVVGLSVYAAQCRTVYDVGPGVSVNRAAQSYGAPAIGFNYDNEAREYLRFADQPATLAFRARSRMAEADTGSSDRPAGPYAGDYSDVESDGPYFETGKYFPDGEIWEVFISPAFGPVH